MSGTKLSAAIACVPYGMIMSGIIMSNIDNGCPMLAVSCAGIWSLSGAGAVWDHLGVEHWRECDFADYLSCHSNNALGSRQAHSCAQLPLGKITHVRSRSSWPTAHIIKTASLKSVDKKGIMGNQRFWQRLHVGMVSKCLHIFQAGNSAQQLPSLCHIVSPTLRKFSRGRFTVW